LLTLRTTERSPKGRLVAITAACPVFLAHQESQEGTENQANLVFPVHPVFPVVPRWKFARKSHHRHADHAHRDHPDQPVHLENLAHPVQMATLAALAKMAVTAHPAQPDPTAPPAVQAKTEKKDQLATQPPPSHRHPEILAHLAKADHQVHPVKMVLQAQMADPVQQETKVPPVRLARPATTVLQETKDHQAQMVPKENRVFAPNIAPPMAVFSSKMAHGDKRFLKALRRFCYTDEKPVFFMSMFAFFIFVFNNYKQSSSNKITAAASPVISFGAF